MEGLLLNALISWQVTVTSQQTPLIERILWMEPGARNIVMTIEIFGKRSLPIVRTYDEIAMAIAANEAQVLSNDPYDSLRRPDTSIKPKHREIRDKA